MKDLSEQILATRSRVYSAGEQISLEKPAEEGGCGVTGFVCTIPLAGRYIYEPSIQMQNRGNGKGGGIAAVGLVPEQMGVPDEVLDNSYLYQIALLDPKCHMELEREYVLPYFDVALSARQPHIDDYRDIPGLEVRPPDVHRYVVRVKPNVLRQFALDNGLEKMDSRELEIWSTPRLGKSNGYYAALDNRVEFEVGLTKHLQSAFYS